jgi:hypothetical protein
MKWTKSKDGIYHRWCAPLFTGLLCKIGLHRWHYWRMSIRWLECFPDNEGVCRTCKRCDWVEMIAEDRMTWRGRV